MEQKAENRTFLHNAIDMVSMGVRSIENDNFSQCFRPVQRKKLYNSGLLYIFSFVVRYFILFPFRFVFLLLGSTFLAVYFFYGLYMSNEFIISQSFNLFFRLFISVFNCHVKHYGIKKQLNVPHLYVANHASFIDFMLLSSHKFCHTCLAESHGGFFGFIFNTILSRNGSIAFKRSEKQQKQEVLRKVEKHIRDNKSPMLVFPEGTCVNNEYVVLFQKGAFELDATICPVGIKYEKKLMDPYWNRRIHCFTVHLLYLMTRWRVDAEVFWLDPMKKQSGETATEFSHRVKNKISQALGLKNTLWNGYFKSSPAINDRMLFRTAFQRTYTAYIKDGFSEQGKKDDEAKRKYLLNERLYTGQDDMRRYLGGVLYDKFIFECCKEYLRLKDSKYEIAPGDTIAVNNSTVRLESMINKV